MASTQLGFATIHLVPGPDAAMSVPPKLPSKYTHVLPESIEAYIGPAHALLLSTSTVATRLPSAEHAIRIPPPGPSGCQTWARQVLIEWKPRPKEIKPINLRVVEDLSETREVVIVHEATRVVTAVNLNQGARRVKPSRSTLVIERGVKGVAH